MNARQITQHVKANKAQFGADHGHEGGKDFDQTTMFVPVATEGKAVIQVQARQNFLTDVITNWRLFHFYRSAAVMAGIAAVWLLFSNVYLSAVAAMAAAWSYGEFLKKDFTINHIYKKRHLLETT